MATSFLAGCFGPEAGALSFLTAANREPAETREVLRRVALYEGDVVVRGPGGYCIDHKTMRDGSRGAFVLLASCEALNGVRGQGVEPVVMTVSVLPDTRGVTRPRAEDIAQLMAPAKVLATHELRDVALVHFASGGQGVLPDGDPRHWRGGMVLNGHLIGLALYSGKGGKMAGKDGRLLLTDLARVIRRSSPTRPASSEKAAPPAGEKEHDPDGLSSDSG